MAVFRAADAASARGLVVRSEMRYPVGMGGEIPFARYSLSGRDLRMPLESDALEHLPPELARALRELEARGAGSLAIHLSGGTPSVVVGGYDRVLLGEAERSTIRAVTAANAHNASEEAGASAAAVLCAAAACEAMLSEYLARFEFHHHGLPPELDDVRQNRDARRQWHDLLKALVPSFDSSTSSAYRQLGCLFKLRDHIAHRHARYAPVGTFPERLDDCIRQGIVPARAAAGADWTSVVFVHEVAQWALGTANTWIGLTADLLPSPCW